MHCFEMRHWVDTESRCWIRLQFEFVLNAIIIEWKVKNTRVWQRKDAIIKTEEKPAHLMRPPGHPVIYVSECCTASPGFRMHNQLVNGWQRENLPHFLFSCWVSLTGDFPKMNNTSSPFNLESSHIMRHFPSPGSRVPQALCGWIQSCGEPT